MSKEFSVEVIRWLSLAIGCAIQLLWGSLGTTPIYINAFKVQYNLTQSTAEMLPAIIAVGRCFTPFASFIFQMYGPVGSFTLGLWLGAGGYFLLWSTTFMKEFYMAYPQLMGLYFFFVGHGSMHTYLGVLTVVTWNFRGKHQGKAVSLVETCYGATPLTWLAIYRLWFTGHSIYDDANQDFTKFLLVHAVISAGGTITAMFLIKPVDTWDEETSALLKDPNKYGDISKHSTDSIEEFEPSGSDKNIEEFNSKKDERHWIRALFHVIKPFTTWPFQLLLWIFCITNTVSLGIEMNLSVYAKSVNLYYLLDAAVITYNVALCVSRLVIGVTIDKLQDRVPKMTFTALLSFATMVTFGVAVCKPGSVAVVMSISLLTGIYCGVTKAITAVIVAKKMDENYFASYWGILQAVQCAVLLIWQQVLSRLYEMTIPEGGGFECHGDNCFRWTFLIASILSFIAVVFATILAWVKRF